MNPTPHRMKGGAPQLCALPDDVEAHDPGYRKIAVLVVPDCPHQRLAE
ncbi:hypothetical protein ACWD00_41815 [Streptomyces viridiviolaceus]